MQLFIPYLICIIILLTESLAPTEARSPPYFGTTNRTIRHQPKTENQNRIETTLGIFLHEILPFKAKFVLKNVSPKCAKALTPLVDYCYQDYWLVSKVMLKVKSPKTEQLRTGCCNLWKYHECVLEAVERLAHYSYNHCTELDAISAESVLEATEAQPRARLMCEDYHKESFYCATFIKGSLIISLIFVLGFTAVLVAVLLAGFTFYLSTLNTRTRIVYIQTNMMMYKGYVQDGTELMDFKEKKIGGFNV